MKALPALLFVCLSALSAQTPAPPAPAPPPGQNAAPATLPDLPGDTVVAVFEDGYKLTMNDFRNILMTLSPDQQQMVIINRQMFLHQYALMRKLSKMAEEEGLDKQSPTREQIEYQRMAVLMQVKMMRTLSLMPVSQEDIAKEYEAHRDNYKQVKVKAIYISFSEDPGTKSGGKKPLTEKEALAKISKLLKEIRGGGDFVKLVKENSEDESSRAKDGDFLTVRANDNLPDAMRAGVFDLKEGEVSEPIRQPNGYYLFRAEQVSYRPVSEVRDQIFTQLQRQKGDSWMRKLDTDTQVQLPNAAFAGSAGKFQLPAPPPAQK